MNEFSKTRLNKFTLLKQVACSITYLVTVPCQ